MKSLRQVIINVNLFLSRIVPDAFTIAILLTVIVFAGGVLSELIYSWSGFAKSILKCLNGWGSEFFTLLEFGMQMSLIILSGYILAVSCPVNRIRVAIIKFPGSGRGVAITVAAISMLARFINWGFGLISGAMLVRAAYLHRRDINIYSLYSL